MKDNVSKLSGHNRQSMEHSHDPMIVCSMFPLTNLRYSYPTTGQKAVSQVPKTFFLCYKKEPSQAPLRM